MSAADVDVLVVGAGPIGLETAAILQADGLSVAVVDAGAVGATIARTFPPQTRFFTSPERLRLFRQGLDPLNQEKLTGEEYLSYLRAYIQTHNLRVSTFERVDGIDGSDPIEVRLKSLAGATRTLAARHLVLATGGTDHPRRLEVPGEDLPNVRSYLGDPHRYAGRRVMIVGGRNSAAESALRCYRMGAQVHLVHRQPAINERVKFWIRPEVESLLKEGRILGHMPEEIASIEPGLVHLESGTSVEVDDVVLQIGFTQDPTIFTLTGVDYGGEHNAPVFDEQTMRTNRDGIFVAGTATAGTQDGFGIFIENCHDHGHRIAAAIAGRPAPPPTPPRPLPEV